MNKTKLTYKKIKWRFGKMIKIPNEWDVEVFGRFAQIKRGASPRPIDDPRYFGDGRGWVRISDVSKSSKYLNKTKDHLSKLGESKSVFVNENDVIMSIAATVGKPIILRMKACIHDGFIVFSNLSTQMEPEFLYYLLKYMEKKLLSMGQHGTQSNINSQLVSMTKFLKPPDNEQKKIASILSGVDACIEKTQEKIVELERLKKGLMQELLTRGIGHTKFKIVKWLFGKQIRIPSEWKFLKFTKVVKTNPPTKIDNSTVPYIPMDAVDTTKAHFNYFTKRKLADFASLPKFQENDVLFASITPSTENGKTCIVENFPTKGIGSSELTVLRATIDVLPRYLYYYLKSHRIRQYAISQMMGTTGRQRVPDSVFKRDLLFELPPIIEQKKIASILSGVDAIQSYFMRIFAYV